MNKREFLDALRAGLTFMPPKELSDVMAEFEEHFEVGVERGHSEQGLVDQLGDPKRIIEAYRSEALDRGGLTIETPVPQAPRVELPKQEPRREPQRQGEPSGAFSSSISIHERHPLADVREIAIEVADCDVLFELTDGEEVALDIEGMTNCTIRAGLSSGVLAVRQEFNWLRILSWRKSPAIRVSIPRVFGGKLGVITASGDIRLPGFKGESLLMKTVSGDFKFGDLYARDRIELHSTSGDLRAGKCMADEVHVHTTSGDMRFGALTCGRLKLNSVSGDVDQEKGCVWEAQTLFVKTVSGDIKLALNDHWQKMEFVTVSGDIKLTLPMDSAPFDVRLDSVSGKLKNQLGSGSGTGREIKGKTVSGDMKIERG